MDNEIQKMKIDAEIIYGLCSFFKGANMLIENDSEIATLHAYLLLQATGIERLQKIIYVLKSFNEANEDVTNEKLKKKLGHKILKIHKDYLESYFSIEDNKYNEKALQILTELVNEKRYFNLSFNIENDQSFDIDEHIVKILDLDNLDYSNIYDLTKISWEIIDIILKKYISVLANLLWHRKVGNINVPCLSDYVLKGWQEVDLEDTIKELLDIARIEKR